MAKIKLRGKLSTNGRVTIPKIIRDEFKIKKGTLVDVFVDGDRVVISVHK